MLIPPGAGANFAQSLPFATPEHRAAYSSMRNAIEGMNGFLKDGAFEGMADPLRRRVRGVAAQSVLVALQVLSANLRKIESFLERAEEVATGSEPRRQRPRRRLSRDLSTWLEDFTRKEAEGRGPADP